MWYVCPLEKVRFSDAVAMDCTGVQCRHSQRLDKGIVVTPPLRTCTEEIREQRAQGRPQSGMASYLVLALGGYSAAGRPCELFFSYIFQNFGLSASSTR